MKFKTLALAASLAFALAPTARTGTLALQDEVVDPIPCEKHCQPDLAVFPTGSVDPGQGTFMIVVTNQTSGQGTNDCGSTCIPCRGEFTFVFAIFNPGSICIEIEDPDGGYVFPPSVNNYNRPGVLTALCSPDFAPFITGRAFDCATEQVIAESTVALECYCD